MENVRSSCRTSLVEHLECLGLGDGEVGVSEEEREKTRRWLEAF